MENALLTTRQTCEALNISRTTLWKLEKLYRIRPVQKLLPVKRYRLSEVEKIVKGENA